MSSVQELEVKPHYDERLRRYDDATTWTAELLSGAMRTEFDFMSDGNELYAHDGAPMTPIFKDALAEAERTATHNPNLRFEARRRKIEAEELKEILAMAQGDRLNTMVVVSDFPPELMDAKEDVGGYNVRRKTAMLRVISKQPDGSIKMVSRSLEGSNRQALEDIYKSMGQEARPGELLGQRMHLKLSHEQQQVLAEGLMGVYDRSLGQQFGGNWHAGWRMPTDRAEINTYDFVRSQSDLLRGFLSLTDQNIDLKTNLYNLAAALQERFERSMKGEIVIPTNSNREQSNAIAEMMNAGGRARGLGVVFAACGLTIKGDSDGMLSISEQLSNLGFGGKTGEETKYKFDKKMHCVNCQPNPKKDEEEKMCGPCGICKDCDTKIRRETAKNEELQKSFGKALLN